MGWLKLVVLGSGGYLLLGVLITAGIAAYQPDGRTTAVLRTFDAEGRPRETVLRLLDADGQLWVQSGQWSRGWYHRLLANPDVELVEEDELVEGKRVTRLCAVPVNTPQAVALMARLLGQGSWLGYWPGRALVLFAPVKPVRLESPSGGAEAPRADGASRPCGPGAGIWHTARWVLHPLNQRNPQT